jgi:class 3 adenylate cyclase
MCGAQPTDRGKLLRMTDAPGGSSSKVARLVFGTRPSPVELAVGPEAHAHELARGGLIFVAIISATAGLGALLPGPQIAHLHAGAVAAIAAFGVLLAIVVAVFGMDWPARVFITMLIPLAPVVMLAIWLAGPDIEVAASVVPAMVAVAFIFHPRRIAMLVSAELFVLYGLMLALADGYPRPVSRWVLLVGFTIAAAFTLESLFAHLNVLADRDRANANELRRAHEQLADANRLLESRVTEQVDEIERLGRLRRFLSPQVAETVLSEGADDLLAVHRRQIAVIFVDLRGFTAFSAVAEPEDVVEVLTDFHAAVGAIVKRLEATVGAFAGDGVMAYFNDPFPCDDPAGKALDMATSLRMPMADLGERWSRRGFRIGYGVGIAYGYATLGTIGFEERSDYTPLGSVVNLASRLCDEAANGEILLDGRAYETLQDRVDAIATELSLKGFSGPVSAYRVAVA